MQYGVRYVYIPSPRLGTAVKAVPARAFDIIDDFH